MYPVHHAASLSAFPGRASLFLNDTEYFSHHLFTIGEFLKRNCSDKDAHFLVFGNGIDVVDDFRRIGQQIYRHMMRSQRDQLVLFLDQISFAGLSSDEKLENVEKTVRDAMYHLLGLGRTLKPILSRTIYLETVGVFLDSVLKVLFDHLSLLENDTSLLNRSLSREDTFQICYVLGILEKCRSLFEFKSGLKEIEHAPIPKYSKSWPQLTSVVKTFEKSLVGDFSEQSIYEYLMQFK